MGNKNTTVVNYASSRRLPPEKLDDNKIKRVIMHLLQGKEVILFYDTSFLGVLGEYVRYEEGIDKLQILILDKKMRICNISTNTN